MTDFSPLSTVRAHPAILLSAPLHPLWRLPTRPQQRLIALLPALESGLIAYNGSLYSPMSWKQLFQPNLPLPVAS